MSVTTAVEPVAPSENPMEVAMGNDFTWVFRGTGGNKPKSYTIEGLPEGVQPSGKVVSGVSSIGGVPSLPGDYDVSIIAWEDEGEKGASTQEYTLKLREIGRASCRERV